MSCSDLTRYEVTLTPRAYVRVVNRAPPTLHRAVTAEDSLATIAKLVSEGWRIVECRLERAVE